MKTEPENGKIILHSCCAPCASASAERLLDQGYEVLLFFSNSNIAPEDEFQQRADSMKKLAAALQLTLEIDPYDHNRWLAAIKGLEQEPEKGKRCMKCFQFSLERTGHYAAGLGDLPFTTSLTISPHKISKCIFEVGAQFPGFQPFDFKKQNGFKRSLDLSEKFQLYRQNYCGCEFSLR